MLKLIYIIVRMKNYIKKSDILLKGFVKMEKLLEKISNYNLFTNLVPGYLFLIMNEFLLNKKLLLDNIIYSFFIAYFIGIVISRFSSLIVENIIFKIFKQNKQCYFNFLLAERNNKKIEILTQDSNMYRSLCSLMIIEFIIKLMDMINILIYINKDSIILLIILLLIVLFAFSYIKQNNYIIQRIMILSKRK